MVNFDIITAEADSDFKEQLDRHFHPAVRLLIKLNRSDRWIRVNLDTSRIENRCWEFSGILSRTVYLNQTTFHQESEVRGTYDFSHGRGTLTIL